ncbi:MAG: hypothetical protein ACXWBN_16470 [Acidimicrobiales bacterium]
MGVELKPGARLRSCVCEAEAIVVKTPAADVDLLCGGHPMVPVGDECPAGLSAAPGFDGGLLIGKRYTDESGEIEVLCTKAGTSSLSLGDELLELKDAKPLPSSD